MLVALLAMLSAAPNGPATEAPDARVSRPVALTVQGADRVQVLTDRPYGQGDRLHRFDAYLPEHKSGSAPVVLLLHGGVGADVPVRPKDALRPGPRRPATQRALGLPLRAASPCAKY